MRTQLWKEIIEESGFDGVSIPYMVGQFFKRGFISEDNLQTPDCIRIILSDITSGTIIGNEPAILLCNAYTPYIPMIQLLNSMNRTATEIQFIRKTNPSIKNNQGDAVLYLQLGELNNISIDRLVEKYWKKYGDIIKEHKFSVESASEIQADGTYHIWKRFEE